MFTDPISDMLTRIRNAALIGKSEVSIPYSKFKAAVAEILQENGYVQSISTEEGDMKSLKLALTVENGQPKVKALDRLSKPGRRVYTKATEIPRPLSGRGLVIVSTSSGVMSGQDARAKGLGGELICKVE